MGKRSDLAGQLQETVQDEVKDTEDRFQKIDKLVGGTGKPAGAAQTKPAAGQKKARPAPATETQPAAPQQPPAEQPAPVVNIEQARKRTTRRNSQQAGFTLPPESLHLLEALQSKAIRARGKNTTKSDVVRVALNVLSELKPADLKKAFESLPPVPRGRPQGDE